MRRSLDRFTTDESGATAIEYGLIAALIAVVALTALFLLSGNTQEMYDNTAARIVAAMKG